MGDNLHIIYEIVVVLLLPSIPSPIKPNLIHYEMNVRIIGVAMNSIMVPEIQTTVEKKSVNMV